MKMVEQPKVSPNHPLPKMIEAFGSVLEFDRSLAPLTSFKTGGRARYFISAESTDEIVRAVTGARRLGIPFFLMGGGSNLLVSDRGFDGLVIRVAVTGMRFIPEVDIECGAGEDLMDLVNFATENSLTGLEFAAGIWGMVGGAIYGNAGAFGGEIGSVLTRATVVDQDGKVREVGPEELKFEYRHSILKETREIVTSARFSLKPGDRFAIQARVNEIIAQRGERHPVDGRSAGCFFKNIPDPSEPHGKLPAGRLLEQVGAKELSVGDARVYERHANIIVNSGHATSQEIRRLADILKKRVQDQFGIELQEEVQQLGSFDEEDRNYVGFLSSHGYFPLHHYEAPVAPLFPLIFHIDFHLSRAALASRSAWLEADLIGWSFQDLKWVRLPFSRALATRLARALVDWDRGVLNPNTDRRAASQSV